MAELRDIKRNIPNLLAGGRYAVRVRAINGLGVKSDWSEAIELESPLEGTNILPNQNATNQELIEWLTELQTLLEDLTEYAYAHAETHFTDGDDPIAPGDIGAATEESVDALYHVPVDTKTADYTIAVSDVGKHLIFNSSSDLLLTAPSDTTAAVPVGSRVDFTRWGTGALAVAEDAGATVASADDALTLRVQFSTATLLKVAANQWLLVGDVVA